MVEKTKAQEIAARFRAMADAVELNGAQPFGGAFVVIPPENGGEVLETLILDNRQDVAQFWGFLKVKAQMQETLIDTQQRLNPAFGRR